VGLGIEVPVISLVLMGETIRIGAALNPDRKSLPSAHP
jgi:hypothetical protein